MGLMSRPPSAAGNSASDAQEPSQGEHEDADGGDGHRVVQTNEDPVHGGASGVVVGPVFDGRRAYPAACAGRRRPEAVQRRDQVPGVQAHPHAAARAAGVTLSHRVGLRPVRRDHPGRPGFRRPGAGWSPTTWPPTRRRFGHAYIATDAGARPRRAAPPLARLDALPGRPGYVTETFCRQARYFSAATTAPASTRSASHRRARRGRPMRAPLLTSLLEAADRVDSTCGLQMAYLKQWAPRACDAARAARARGARRAGRRACAADADDAGARRWTASTCAYLDPPYNQHSLLLELPRVGDDRPLGPRPRHYGVARKRIDCRATRSPFNSSPRGLGRPGRPRERLRTPWLILSINDEGFHDPAAWPTCCRSAGPRGRPGHRRPPLRGRAHRHPQPGGPARRHGLARAGHRVAHGQRPGP